MNLKTTLYLNQTEKWPQSDQHILAQFDDASIIVYQAYRPAIGHFAARHGFFGGEFSYSRMSWIKPNFLWMMYRSGWGTKPGQEVTLAIRLKRDYFDQILLQAVASSFTQSQFESHEEWKANIAGSDVRLQWDPDHDPYGKPLPRRAIQLGLGNKVLQGFKGDAIIAIEDISSFVHEQRQTIQDDGLASLLTPTEAIYPVSSEARTNLGMVRWQ